MAEPQPLAAGLHPADDRTEFIGGDVILTIPHEWQVLFNNSKVEVKERINDPVDPKIIDIKQWISRYIVSGGTNRSVDASDGTAHR